MRNNSGSTNPYEGVMTSPESVNRSRGGPLVKIQRGDESVVEISPEGGGTVYIRGSTSSTCTANKGSFNESLVVRFEVNASSVVFG